MSSDQLNFKTPNDLLKFIKENDIQFIDLNFTDLRGKWHHTAEHVSVFDKDMIKDGVYFDGSSIAGWREIHESDMNLRPDISKVSVDPFAAQPTIKIFCDIYDPKTGEPYNRDPRYIARRAEEFMSEAGVADTSYFGPEAEFFVFEDVKIHTDQNHIGFEIDSPEGPYNSGRHYDTGNSGHRPRDKGGYFPDAPVDSLADIRAEMVTVMQSMGLGVEKHHHEVAPAQCEIGILFATLRECADNLQLYKYVVHNVANSYGKTATFMPKPVYGDNGSGMHCHQSLWKSGKPLFAGKEYAGLSKMALHYIGGIIHHGQALNAFTNPATNSYKRLVPGYEAPVHLTYSQSNRSAACRIPQATSPNGKRVEVRFPDACANPYLAFAAMLMAGLDGIKNKIEPGPAMDKDLYAMSKKELANVPSAAHSLRAALDALKADHKFLLEGDVFTKDLVEAYTDLKEEEVEAYEQMVHPIEYAMYYSS